MTRPAHNHSPLVFTLVLLALIWMLVLLACTPLEAQALKPGVGLPGVPTPAFERFWCQQHRPGGCSHRAPAGFDCSACPRQGWLGHYGESFPRSQMLLRTCWETNAWGTKASHNGQYTPAELEWAQVSVSRTGPLSRTCWYDVHEIGGESQPIILTDLTAERYWSNEVQAAKRVGAWKAGVFAYAGYDPVVGGRVSADAILDDQGRPRRGLWPVWLDNRTTNADPVEPEPQPEPQPPEPEPGPACTPYAGSSCEDQCIKGAERWGWTVERCLEVSRFCRGTCSPDPEEPDDPDPEEEVRCWEAIELPRATQRFVPGVPSTGRLEVEVFPMVEVPCVPEVEP